MSSSINIPSHQPGDWITVWVAPKRRRWWKFWDRGRTYFVKTDPSGPTQWTRVRG